LGKIERGVGAQAARKRQKKKTGKDLEAGKKKGGEERECPKRGREEAGREKTKKCRGKAQNAGAKKPTRKFGGDPEIRGSRTPKNSKIGKKGTGELEQGRGVLVVWEKTKKP